MNIINRLAFPILWKDKNLRYRGGNECFLKLLGLNSIKDLKGRTDFDLHWSHSHAEKYIQDDLLVLSGNNKYNYTETQPLQNGKLVTVVVSKWPMLERGKVSGIICQYQIQNKPPKQLLPPQQYQCMLRLSQGLSIKQIANEMRLSVRTIEFYVQILKKKLNCRSTIELITKFLKIQASVLT